MVGGNANGLWGSVVTSPEGESPEGESPEGATLSKTKNP